MSVEARSALMQLRRLFTSGRWIQGSYRRYSQETRQINFCLIGGLQEVTDYNDMLRGKDGLLYLEAYRAIHKATGEHPVTFNDATGRKVEEIIAKIDEAIVTVTPVNG